MWNTAFPSFLIGLREGLEAGLVVSILVATLVRGEARDRLGAVWTGVAAAVALSLSFAAVLTFTSASLPAGGQDAFGGILSLLAVCFVTSMVFWMRRNARSLSGDLKGRMQQALERGSGVIVLTAFLAVGREGLETSLFLWTTARSSGQAKGPALGAAVGILLAVGLCWALYRRVLRINLTKFFTATGIVLIVIAAGVLAYGLGDLQEGALLPGYGAHAVHLTGIDAGSWYATLIAGTFNLTPVMTWLQVIGYVVYLGPTMVLFVLGVRAADRITSAAAQPASTPEPTTRAARAIARRRAQEAALVERLAAKAHATAEPAVAGRVPRWAVYGSIVAVPAVAAVGAISVMGHTPAASTTQITITESDCGTGWTNPIAGSQSFEVVNNGSNTAEVYLINPASNTVYGEDPDVTPGSNEIMNVSIGAGSYVFRCSFVDGTVLNSGKYTVSGSGGSGGGGLAGLAPVTEQDMQDPVDFYRAYVQTSLPGLLTAAQRLDADLKVGNLAQAKTDWLPAHLDYERLGAAYGTFDDFDAKINGSASGLPQGTATKDWTGFFRIEYGLWHGQPAAELAPAGNTLVTDIEGLIKAFPGQTTPATDLPLRTHEILENALQFQLTGIQNYGSGTTLDTLYANTQGTQQVLGTISALIQARDPAALGRINNGIATLQADLRAAGAGPCTTACPMPTPLGSLDPAQRQKVDADLGSLLENLSLVPDMLEERTTA